MKKLEVLLLLSFILFVGCIHVVVNMDNVFSSLDKKEYNIEDEISINMYGKFLPEEFVTGGVVYISVTKNTEIVPFKVVSVSGLNDFSDNEYYDDFRYVINPKKGNDYLTSLDEFLTIKLKETGNYVLSLFFIISSSKQLQDVSKIINIPFTVTE